MERGTGSSVQPRPRGWGRAGSPVPAPCQGDSSVPGGRARGAGSGVAPAPRLLPQATAAAPWWPLGSPPLPDRCHLPISSCRWQDGGTRHTVNGTVHGTWQKTHGTRCMAHVGWHTAHGTRHAVSHSTRREAAGTQRTARGAWHSQPQSAVQHMAAAWHTAHTKQHTSWSAWHSTQHTWQSTWPMAQGS